MTSNSRAEIHGPRYVMALYDGPRHVGYATRQGARVLSRSDDPAVDLFHSELGVRSQARLRAIEFAPLTIVPYDLVVREPLDPIPSLEEPEMPLKDEETRQVKENAVPFVIDKTVRQSRDRDKLRKMTRKLISAQYALTRLLDRFNPMSED